MLYAQEEGERVALILDNDRNRSKRLQDIFRFLNCKTLIIETIGQDVIASLNGDSLFAAFICTDGIERVDQPVDALKDCCSRLPVFLLSETLAEADIPLAVKNRIHGLLTLPLEYRELSAVLRDLVPPVGGAANRMPAVSSNALSSDLVGKSPGINRIRQLIGQVSGSEVNVLILGESGTGKEVVARNVHYYSSRRHAPFVPVNCGAIPAELLESELFGHEKGAFTGAITARKGRFELAAGGTLFLDEIGDMPLHMQVKLLRVLQERTFERVGSNKTLQANVRIIAATHQNLDQMVEDGSFRADLYYRLNVFPMELPPLRERPEDIPLLIEECQARLGGRNTPFQLGATALRALCGNDWPGNVRELANVVERLNILYPGQTVGLAQLPEKYQNDMLPEAGAFPDKQANEQSDDFVGEAGALSGSPRPDEPDVHQLSLTGMDLKDYISTIESRLIMQALQLSDGVVAQASKLLNLRRTTLVEKMRKYQISRPEGLTEF